MANKIAFRSLLILVITLMIGCNSPRTNRYSRSTLDVVTNNLGKTVELVGEAVGSKADYAFKIESAAIAIDSAWDPKVFDPAKKTHPTLLITAYVDWEKGGNVTRTDKRIQTTARAGETIPGHYILRKVRIVKVLDDK